jgi:hypothetical protein
LKNGAYTAFAIPGEFATALAGINNKGVVMGNYWMQPNSFSRSWQLLRAGFEVNLLRADARKQQRDRWWFSEQERNPCIPPSTCYRQVV